MTATTTDQQAIVPAVGTLPEVLTPAPAQQNPALVYLASLSESSRRTMGEALDTIAAIATGDQLDAASMPWGQLRYQHTQAIRATLAERYSASTANRHLSALRGVLKDAWRLGYMTAEDYQRAIDLKPVKGQKASQAETGRHLQAGELSALIRVCVTEGTLAGARDAAIIAIGYACGLRRSELAALQLADFDADTGTLIVRAGKGNKERVLPLEGGAKAALLDWLAVRGDAPGALFLAIRKGDHVVERGMTDQAVYYILERRYEQAEVKAFAPHDLRRTFAGDLLDAGADIVTVQKLMGHANANTTAGYDRRDAQAKRKAVSRLHVPYQRRSDT